MIGITLKFVDCVKSVVISPISILPIQEYGVPLCLFVSFLISFISILQFSEYRSFASLGRFISKYFILFWGIRLNILSGSDINSQHGIT